MRVLIVLLLVALGPVQGSSADIRNTSPAAGRPEASASAGAASPTYTLASGGALDDYLAMARSASPMLRAAVARSEAARERAIRAGGLPDPTVTYGHYFDEVETRVGPQTHRFGLRQTLPWFGKLSLARRAGEERAKAEEERRTAAELDVAVEVTRAYAEYAYLASAVRVTEERVSLLTALEGVVRTSYSNGDASYGDLMKAQIGLARFEDRLASLLARRRPASSRLAAAVGLDTDHPLPWPGGTPEARSVTYEMAVGVSVERSPDLLALDHQVEAARLERSLAGRGYLPDLTVGFDYIVTDEAAMPVDESGKDPLIGVASLSVPLWFGKHAATIDEADANLRASEGKRQQAARDLEAELDMKLFELGDAERMVLLYGDRLVPMARQSLGATQAAYRTGESGFDALVSAHETLLEFELAHARARADVLILTAELARVTGDVALILDGTAPPER